MAKGNLLLGTAKNSVGDVVMYRREGAQISRVRVRTIKNPKTDAQSFQRAIMAPIAKFYSPLSVVLERSFEGLSKAKSHNKFNQVNANLARKKKWALPKGTSFWPVPYQLSEGTLPEVGYAWTSDDNLLHIFSSTAAPGTTTVGHLSALFVSLGYKEGDIVTIILVCENHSNGFYPVSKQFVIDSDSEVLLTAAFPGMTITLNPEGVNGVNIMSAGDSAQAGAVIVARFDGNMWRRSTQSLSTNLDLIREKFNAENVAAAIASYGMTAGDGNPLVYLDGDELTDGQ